MYYQYVTDKFWTDKVCRFYEKLYDFGAILQCYADNKLKQNKLLVKQAQPDDLYLRRPVKYRYTNEFLGENAESSIRNACHCGKKQEQTS